MTHKKTLEALLQEYGVMAENDINRVPVMLSQCEFMLQEFQAAHYENKLADSVKRTCQFFRIIMDPSAIAPINGMEIDLIINSMKNQTRDS